MEQPGMIFTSSNGLSFYNKRPEITEEEVRFMQTHLERFPRRSLKSNTVFINITAELAYGAADSLSAGTKAAYEESVLNRPRISTATGTRPPPVYRGPPLNKDDLGKSTETMTQNPAATLSGTKVEADGGYVLKHP